MIFEKRWKQNTFIGLIVLVILLLCFWGTVNAIKSAQSKSLIRDGQSIVQGFEYYKKDQNRYPFTSDFSNVDMLKEYINRFPPKQYLTATCETNFEYFSDSPESYELRICLPKGAKGLPAGWSIFATK